MCKQRGLKGYYLKILKLLKITNHSAVLGHSFNPYQPHLCFNVLLAHGSFLTTLSLFVDGVSRKHLDSPYLSPYLRQGQCSYHGSTAVHMLSSNGTRVN